MSYPQLTATITRLLCLKSWDGWNPRMYVYIMFHSYCSSILLLSNLVFTLPSLSILNAESNFYQWFIFSRFLLIGYPLKAKQILTRWNVRISILVIWIVAIVTTLPLPIRFTFVAVAHFKEVWLWIMHKLNDHSKYVVVSDYNLFMIYL